MEERVTKGQLSTNQRQRQKEEILDIADLLEDVPELSAADKAADDGGLDLADIAAPEFQADEDPIDLDQIFNEFDEEDADDDIVDLVDLADEDEPNETPAGTGSPETIETGQEDPGNFSFEDLDLESSSMESLSLEEPDTEVDLDEDFISASELEELLGDSPKSQNGIGPDQEVPENRRSEDIGLVDAFDMDLLPDSDETAPLGDGKTANPGTQAVAGEIFAAAVEEKGPAVAGAVDVLGIDEAQLDAALERVIRKIYAEKIDSILVEAIEKTVQKEINRLKALINLGTSDR